MSQSTHIRKRHHCRTGPARGEDAAPPRRTTRAAMHASTGAGRAPGAAQGRRTPAHRRAGGSAGCGWPDETVPPTRPKAPRARQPGCHRFVIGPYAAARVRWTSVRRWLHPGGAFVRSTHIDTARREHRERDAGTRRPPAGCRGHRAPASTAGAQTRPQPYQGTPPVVRRSRRANPGPVDRLSP